METVYHFLLHCFGISGIAIGGPMMIMGFMHMGAGTKNATKRILFGAALVIAGLATPNDPTNDWVPPVDKQSLNRIA